MPVQPENTTLIALAFQHPLNFPFVVGHQVAIAQIFDFLPKGMSYGLQIPIEDIKMKSLEPYNTQDSKGYITTLALAYIPSSNFTSLDGQRHVPNSRLLTNPQPEINQMMNLLDPTVPLNAVESDPASGGSSYSGGSSGGSDGGSQSGSGPTNADPIGSSTGKVTSKGVGIAGGVSAGAALYGAAMFFVARRYKKRRARHSRSSSISRSISPTGGVGTGAVMHGAARNPYVGDARGSRGSRGIVAARTQGISAPIVAENSLGWN